MAPSPPRPWISGVDRLNEFLSPQHASVSFWTVISQEISAVRQFPVRHSEDCPGPAAAARFKSGPASVRKVSLAKANFFAFLFIDSSFQLVWPHSKPDSVARLGAPSYRFSLRSHRPATSAARFLSVLGLASRVGVVVYWMLHQMLW